MISKSMQSSTQIESPVLELISVRKSRRAYSTQAVEVEKIRTLFEAARWAPSSMNEQPWQYIYATQEEPDLREQILASLNPSNQVWASHAPLLVVSLFRTYHTRNNAPNNAAKYDVGSANAFLTLQATHLGLNVHQMGGFDAQKAKDLLNVPPGYDVAVVIAIGYPGEADALPENLKVRELTPRIRFQQHEFVLNKAF